ncbi:MAG: DUF58 domain-containing protein [Verrucomicrobiaceae bacterium]|nr:DUF58 domain-containing protein [Verrucomicrobiaceae bacterium]
MPLPIDSQVLDALAGRARTHAERFFLPLREHHWRGNAGDYVGGGIGSSLDFQDHRTYLPGDDPRHINWQAYARTGEYSLKLYREEVQPIVEILFDVSGSMFIEPDKATRALELFYFARAAGEKSGAATGAILVKGDHWKPLESDAVFSHRWQDFASALPDTAASAPPNLAAVPLRARSLRVFISDLLFPSDPESLLRALQRGAGKAIVLAPFSPAESDPDWSGNYAFIDSESGDRHDRRIHPALLRRYLDAYRDHFARWKAASLRVRTPLARVPAATNFEKALQLEALSAGALQPG